MAYVSKEKKAVLVEKVKAVLPKGWKVTFSVKDYSTFIVRIKETPFDFFDFFPEESRELAEDSQYGDINEYYYKEHIKNEKLVEIVEKIVGAMNFNNHDNSDAMTDYFDVGHYIRLSVGRFDAPYVKKA